MIIYLFFQAPLAMALSALFLVIRIVDEFLYRYLRRKYKIKGIVGEKFGFSALILAFRICHRKNKKIPPGKRQIEREDTITIKKSTFLQFYNDMIGSPNNNNSESEDDHTNDDQKSTS